MLDRYLIALFLARWLGLLFVVIGLAMVFCTEYFQKMIKEIGSSFALSAITTFLPLVAGLSLALGQRVFSPLWRLLIALIGWLLLAVSLWRLFFYKIAMKKMRAIEEQKVKNRKHMMLLGFILFILGAYLAWHGFLEMPRIG